jgi:WhiB family redox-sensing transcriptional regulator
MAAPDPQLDALVARLTNRPSWHREALCRGVGTEVFFVGAYQSTDQARALCAACPVRDECLAALLEDPLTQGIWAGTT